MAVGFFVGAYAAFMRGLPLWVRLPRLPALHRLLPREPLRRPLALVLGLDGRVPHLPGSGRRPCRRRWRPESSRNGSCRWRPRRWRRAAPRPRPSVSSSMTSAGPATRASWSCSANRRVRIDLRPGEPGDSWHRSSSHERFGDLLRADRRGDHRGPGDPGDRGRRRPPSVARRSDRGLEADESLLFGDPGRLEDPLSIDLDRDPPPDLVIEIEMTRTFLDRLACMPRPRASRRSGGSTASG